MEKPESVARLERHALVTAIWLPFGLTAGSLLHYGYLTGTPAFQLAGFGAVAAGFIGHVIVDAALGTTFRTREIALGLVAYATSLVAFGLAVLIGGLSNASVLATSAGFVAIFLVVIFYMAVALGVRRAFDSFDVIREFRAGSSQESET